MAETYYYQVKFRADCEECGKRFEGVVAKQVPVNDATWAGDVGNALADMGDLAIRRKSLESAVRDKRWADLDMRYGAFDSNCPHCGARQSWDPMEKPEEPKRTAKGKAGTIAAYLFGAFFLGGIVALVFYLVQSFGFDEDDPTFMLIVWLACLVAGLVLGIRATRMDDASADATYPERLRQYEEQLARYNAFQAEVAARTKRNEPVVDLKSGVTFSRVLHVYEWGKADPHSCPSCGRKLEGTVRMNSVEASRVAVGKCPWCGSELPAGRTVYLGTK